MKAILAVVLLVAWMSTASQVAAQAGNSEGGKRIFAGKTCGSCHGSDGQGSGTAPRIGPPGPSYPDFLQYVRQPTGKMPPVTPQMASDTELADIYAYLKTIAPSGQASFSAAPGDMQRGKKIYASDGCFQCHGYQGQGSTQTAASRIGPPAISLQTFATYIRHPSGVMPPYTSKAVPDQDVADIFAFLQSIPPPPPLSSIPLLNQ